jgi:hypothetical protein
MAALPQPPKPSAEQPPLLLHMLRLLLLLLPVKVR